MQEHFPARSFIAEQHALPGCNLCRVSLAGLSARRQLKFAGDVHAVVASSLSSPFSILSPSIFPLTMEELKVEQKFVVSWGKVQLVPTQKLVDGIPYMCLSKWDRSSVRLLSGKALDLRKQKRDQAGSLHCSAWDSLLELRQQEANKLLQDALKEDEENARDSTKKKPIRAQSKHTVMLPLSMPVVFHGHKMNILLEGLGSQTIWVELTEQNILLLHEKCSSSEAKPKKIAKKSKKAKKNQDKGDDAGDDAEDEEGEEQED